MGGKLLHGKQALVEIVVYLRAISSEIDCLIGLVVKASILRAADPGFDSRLCWHFSGSSYTSDLKFVLLWLVWRVVL